MRVPFSPKSYELNAQAKAALATLAEAAKADRQVSLAVKEQTKGLKKSSIAFILERDRSLRVFQDLVRAGVEPAQVVFEPVARAKGEASELMIESRHGEQVASTPAPQTGTQSAAKAGETSEFVIDFPSGSADPLNLDGAKFQDFVAAVGAPGHDAVVIEGKTDKSGSAAYNQALGELRALTVYERLVRAGLPSLRIDTQSLGAAKSSGKTDESSRKADRRVTVRWTQNAAIAAEAKAAEAPTQPPTPPPPPAKVEEPKPVEAAKPVEAPKAQEMAQSEPAKASSDHMFDIIVYGGGLFGGGQLQHEVKPGGTYGLGLDKDIATLGMATVRATVEGGMSTLAARPGGLSGPLKISYGLLRADYVLNLGFVHPYAGVGAGYYQWKTAISQAASGLENKSSKRDGGLLLAVGADFPVASFLTLAPEATCQRIYGAFNESVWSLWLALRWGI